LDFRTPVELAYPGSPHDSAASIAWIQAHAAEAVSRPALPGTAYPASVADIHYGIRWLKTHAAEFGSRADLVGVLGESSGGHLGLLVGMRPHDPRYTAIALPGDAPAVDARVRCVVLCYPVIDPLSRYRYAKHLKATSTPCPAWVDIVLALHDKYWPSEAAMAEGNPALALERGERVELPPVLYIQATGDPVHPAADLQRFVANYRKAGGHVELALFEAEEELFIHEQPDSPIAVEAIAKIIEFVHAQVR
jgi:acetyl esterase/lipase